MISAFDRCNSTNRSGLVLLPGSRQEHVDVALPFMIDMLSHISICEPVTIMVSPFIHETRFEQLSKRFSLFEFKRMKSVTDLSSFKFALTIPGTNTMHLSLSNIPYLMILPTHQSKFYV